MASQLPSLAAPAGLCLLSALAAALLVLTLYVLGAVASFAVFCAGEFARRDPGRPPLTGTMLRQLKNFDRLFDEHVRYALAHRTSRLVYPGHSELFTADPAVVEHVLRTNFSKYSKGAYNIGVMKDLFGDGIFAIDGDSWRHQRKLASHEFSTKVLREFSSVVFRANATRLVDKISSAAANRTILNMQKAREDILSRFIIASKEDPEMINDCYLRDIVLNFLIAGKDTTGNTLSWFLYMLCKNPIVQDKVALEIKESVEWAEEDNNREDFTARLNDRAIDKMHYLHAAISETLRLYPAVPVDGKMAEDDDVLPNGYKVIKGDGINYMIYAMGRMTYLWGEDAEDFRPERWIANGVFQQESPYKFVSFNAGPRTCLGKDFAYRQMKIMAATLIHFFRFKLTDESKDATYKTMFTLHMDKGLKLYAYPRSI
ncbi:putative cytochrome P450 superfamily protein isoform X1 [Zea mays]|uniref:putative cytochrome P450 superfamily protein isoform X1 n=1 Tax=Zea mays TaxID=4577 RepID=UPI000C6C7234|nr:putative cytochrome P450 superfamily protein isoform X1 [Zea mays]|eukprot:XP_023156013.1 putative cytochrome P450 superfamily protein isoform X1 [Zea mays]